MLTNAMLTNTIYDQIKRNRYQLFFYFSHGLDPE